MKACSISITSAVDGTESVVKREGEMQISLLEAELFYREEEGEVRIFLQSEQARIERTGGYSLRLFLEEGKESVGMLGINGQEGEIPVYCDRVAYSTGEGSLLVSLGYRLILGTQTQEMKLRILAREKKGK
ncbi:MAG: DUF1934 family protein [Clostridia bacterium]|nr:DUF1934 family protein [Clostridia bacterium]